MGKKIAAFDIFGTSFGQSRAISQHFSAWHKRGAGICNSTLGYADTRPFGLQASTMSSGRLRKSTAPSCASAELARLNSS